MMPNNPNEPPSPFAQSQGSVMMWEAMKNMPVDRQMTISFIMSQPEFVEDEDTNLVKKQSPVLARNVLATVALGIVANLQLKKIPGFFSVPKLLRYIIRVPVFFAPGLLFYNDTLTRVNLMNNALDKYQNRLLRFQKTGEMKVFDPEGKLTKRFHEQMNKNVQDDMFLYGHIIWLIN